MYSVSSSSGSNAASNPQGSPQWHYKRLSQLKQRVNDRQLLIKEYTKSIQELDFQKHSNDIYLLSIWLDFIDFKKEEGEAVGHLYEKMKSLEVGSRIPRFYEHWCSYLKSFGDMDELKRVLDMSKKSIVNKDEIEKLVGKFADASISQVTVNAAGVNKENAEPSGGSSRASISNKPKRLGLMGPPMRIINGVEEPVELTGKKYSRSPPQQQLQQDYNSERQQQQISAQDSDSSDDFKNDDAMTITEQLSIVTATPLVKRTSIQASSQQKQQQMSLSSQSMPTPAATSKQQASHAPPPSTPAGLSRKTALMVNGQVYAKLDLIGKGGSSKVFKVLSPDGQIYALKRVQLKGVDAQTISGYLNEIALLKKLDSCERIIHLVDQEINKEEGFLHMVMECGEIDLAHVLQKHAQTGERLSMNFVRVYWEQMLQAVDAIHEERIVHSDLKPANFLFVKGALKLIDFGIAKAIQNDTTNIHREHTMGTVNYMSPEAILDTNANKEGRPQCMKLGRASDVWSLGCILYQMIYGKTPFHDYAMIPKLQRIIDAKHPIDYPQVANPYLLDVLKHCLQRDPKKRYTIPELLQHLFLRPDVVIQQLSTNPPPSVVQAVVEKTMRHLKANQQLSVSEITKMITRQQQQ
ncbi:hypothetical protein MIR68_003069 [Amoeboaphelidium protococcarum]|nr:hypothetical protein MIR68_003069 [Amoeboaphelidium protococcarum]